MSELKDNKHKYYDKQSLNTPKTDRDFEPEDVVLLSRNLTLAIHSDFSPIREDNVILSSIGNALIFINLKTNEQTYLLGRAQSSIGSIAVHPSRKYFAVAEVCKSGPFIYIYEYPSLSIFKLLRNGSEKIYADLDFNNSGTKLASVGGDPDYLLTVWEWESETIILRSKAFSQDVYKCAFSPENDGILTTSGMGHIKFWKMYATFTGLKLQGHLGKFGSSELTDIVTFIQLPDGKVLSSTETGNLLLWDGGMIKCELATKGKKPCHVGRIETISMADAEIVTSGEDGYIRVWDLETIDNADVTTSDGNSSVLAPRIYEMEPIDEILVSKDVKVRAAIRFPESSDFLIQDQNGSLIKLDVTKRSIDKFYNYHSGAVAGVDSSPLTHKMATLGSDGTLRFYEYKTKTVVNKINFAQGGSVMSYLPLCLDIAGNTIIAGFMDGVLRIISDTPNGINLHHVFKPHKEPITCIAISEDGSLIITGSEDKTIFLFSIQHQGKEKDQNVPFSRFSHTMKPLGYVVLENIPVSISFSAEDNLTKSPFVYDISKPKVVGNRVLITLKDGDLISGIVPINTSFDTSLTYEIPASKLSLKKWEINVKEKIVPEKVVQTEEGSEQKEEVILTKEEQINIGSTSKFSNAIFLRNGYFCAAISNSFEELELRLCHVLAPTFSKVIYIGTATVSSMCLDRNAKYLMLGLTNGTSTIISFNLNDFITGKLEDDHETVMKANTRFLSSLEEHKKKAAEQGPDASKIRISGTRWNGYSHDILTGKITKIQTSFDDAFIFTSGADGGVFIWRFVLNEIKDSQPYQGDVSDQVNQLNQPQDITSPSNYSIQESKMKAEKDRELQKAEAKKLAIRNAIQDLRNEFMKILAENQNHENPLPGSELNVDPYLDADIEAEKKEKIINVNRELAWITEKEAIGPRKLKAAFLDPLENERITLYSLKSGKSVSTFRTLKLDPEISQLLAPKNLDDNHETDHLAQLMHKEMREPHIEHEVSKLSQLGKHNTSNKLEARKQQRAARQAILKALLEEKPDEKYEDPQDVAAIRYAETHMGDYKLKSSPNYIVPESERIDADKKKRQILLLRQSIHSLQVNFNNQVISLRSKKQKIVETLKERFKKLGLVNHQLAALGDLVESTEWKPKNRYIVTATDIAEIIKQERENQSKKGGDELGFSNASQEKTETKSDAKDTEEQYEEVEIPSDSLEFEHKKIVLKYERNKIISSIDTDIKRFDESLNDLRQERAILQADLKTADIKLLLLFQEWLLLKEFEKFDISLTEKLETKKAEQIDIESKLNECREKVAIKKDEVENILLAEKEIQDEFKMLMGESNKNEEYLTKVFKRKIKRVKKKTKGQQIDDDDDQEEEEDDSDDDFSDDEEENDFEEKCPSDCDIVTWNRIIDLRERRLDQEEILQEMQKVVEQLKKENEGLLKKEKTVMMALKNTENEIQEFQTQKQRKLNELNVVVPLRLHQIYYMENNELPTNLSAALVFVNSGLTKLRNRIKEVQLHKELKRQHVNYNKSKKEKQLKLQELEDRSRDVQMLKFGRIIDLEKLERLGVNRVADELREKAHKEDISRTKELGHLNREIETLQTSLTALTKDNTTKLERIVELRRKKNDIEDNLNQGQSTVTAEYSGPQRKDIEERKKLAKLVSIQEEQIELLRKEIESLIRKPSSGRKAPIKEADRSIQEIPPLPAPMAIQDSIIEEAAEFE